MIAYFNIRNIIRINEMQINLIKLDAFWWSDVSFVITIASAIRVKKDTWTKWHGGEV